MYKKGKKEAKKVVSVAKFKAYDDLYKKLGTREADKDVFKLAKIRETKIRELHHVKCIKTNEKGSSEGKKYQRKMEGIF